MNRLLLSGLAVCWAFSTSTTLAQTQHNPHENHAGHAQDPHGAHHGQADPHADPHAAAQSNPHVDPHGAITPDTEPLDPALEQRVLTNVRQLTYEGRRAGEGYFSPDGSEMVFQSEREEGNPFFQIYVMDMETGDTERVSPGIGKTTCSWLHPDGKRVLFASTHLDPEAKAKQQAELDLRAAGKQRRYSWDYDEHYDIFAYDRATKQYTRLTDAVGYDAEGDYSPDGKQIVFASNRQAYERELTPAEKEKFELDPAYFMDIYIMNADGSNVRRLTDVPGYDGGPFFSPDGGRIIWRRFDEEGLTAEVYTMKTDGSDVRQLTHMSAMSWAPYYHPSGDYAIYTTNKHGFANFELYIVSSDGKRGPVRVTYTDGWDGLPVFMPDGKHLVWCSKRGVDNAQLFIGDWDDAAARKLLAESGAHAQAAHVEMKQARPVAAVADTQTVPAITPEDVRKHVAYLASEDLEGRLTGTVGEQLATEYVADWFKRYGLEPAGEDGSYFQGFSFNYGVALGEDNRLVAEFDGDAKQMLALDKDWRPLAFSLSGDVEPTEVAFAGYGIVAPDHDEYGEYDSFVHSNIEGKWVIVLRYLPDDVPDEQRQWLSRYGSLRYKAMVLRDKGAAGMIVVAGPNAQVKKQLVDLKSDTSLAGTSIPAISLTTAQAERMISAAGKSLQELQDTLDKGEMVMAFDLPGVRLGGAIDLSHVKKSGRNVLGRLRADAKYANEPALVIGAHVDHLGRGRSGSSLAKDDEADGIHYGADDNASGVAGVLEIAEYINDQKQAGKLTLKRDVIFAAWSGEELGLIGSNHFVDELDEQTDADNDISSRVAALLNMDMIGRLDEKVILNGVGSSSVWKGEIERRNVPVGLTLKPVEDAYVPTDSTPFYLNGVPTLTAFTGAHADYHTPRDTPEKLDYDGAAKIAKLMGLIGRSLAMNEDEPDYIKQDRPASSDRPRAGLRAYLGTIPDYAASDEPGVKLSGVTKGAPAGDAGLQGGDRIVELAGRKIENIYDYTYAIDTLKIGEKVSIVVLRKGERLELEITPGSRD